MAQDPFKYFRLEARELLDRFGKTILEFERGRADAGQLQILLRLAHTLKGAARVVKQPEIADRAHRIEDILGPYREGPDNLPSTVVAELLAHLEEIDGRVRALTPAEPPASAQGYAVDDNLKAVQADLSEIDNLIEGVAETHTLLGALRRSGRAAEQARHLASLLFEQIGPRESQGDHVGRTTQMAGTAEELRRSLTHLERDVVAAVDQIDRELRQLREAAEQLRLVPASNLMVLLERTVRDAAGSLAKRATFEARGGELRIDAYVLSVVQPALIQIVRNAMAHGIENEDERTAKGKPASGRIVVAVSHQDGKLAFSCEDDGRGVDLEAVRRAAARRGLSKREAEGLSPDDLVRLLLKGGLTTSDSVTPIAGRGIGLDIVREAAARLDGSVGFRTDHRGTRFDLVVPMSLASMDALVVDAGGTTVAIPLGAVRGAVRLANGEVSWNKTKATVIHDGVAYPFLSLTAALRGKAGSPGRAWQGFLVAGPGGMAVAGADRLVGISRVVTRPLPQLAPASRIVSGAWFDAQGNPQLALDPAGLVAAARRGLAGESEPVSAAHSVLVVDDSLTSRMLEQSILESAGFDVDTAASAEEALEAARRRKYALFLVDVEMPGMTGFDFVERIRADAALRDIPAIMITSRSSAEDFARGQQAGAQGYMVKSEFDQVRLLTLIRSLLG
jgi:two-component system chemotaxis sensor kinase CheA